MKKNFKHISKAVIARLKSPIFKDNYRTRSIFFVVSAPFTSK